MLLLVYLQECWTLQGLKGMLIGVKKIFQSSEVRAFVFPQKS